MRKHLNHCKGICSNAGLNVLRVEHRRKHVGIVCEEGTVIMPSTPGDRRWHRNARSFARKMAGGL